MKIPWPQLEEAIKNSHFGVANPGFCLACGNEQEGCEPDAENYECEACGKHKVYGAEQILMMGHFAE